MSTTLALSICAPSLPASVPAAVREAATALKAGHPVAELTTAELGDSLVVMLPATALLLGHSRTLTNSADVDALADAVAELIHRRFARLNLAEIGQALRRGASGEWPRHADDVLLVSLPHVAHWLDCYCRLARTEAQLALGQAQSLALPAPLPPQIDYVGSVVDFVALARAQALPVGFELDMGNVLYTWLKGIGALNGFRTPAEYVEMQGQEADRLLSTAVPASGSERREYTSFVNALRLDGQLPDAHPLSRSVVNACKKRVLREWLEHHAAAGTDMPTHLSQFLTAPDRRG